MYLVYLFILVNFSWNSKIQITVSDRELNCESREKSSRLDHEIIFAFFSFIHLRIYSLYLHLLINFSLCVKNRKSDGMRMWKLFHCALTVVSFASSGTSVENSGLVNSSTAGVSSRIFNVALVDARIVERRKMIGSNIVVVVRWNRDGWRCLVGAID